MTVTQALRLSTGQALCALDEVDLLPLITERLIGEDREVAPVLLAPGPALRSGRPPGAETAVEDPGTGAVALLPTATLEMIWVTGLAVLACRALVAPGVLTAAVFGAGSELDLQVSVLARYLPALSHVSLPRALVPAPGGRDALAELDLTGIGLAVIPDSRRAALGANLIVVTASAGEVPDLGTPAPGTLLVNATGRDLPGPVLDRVERVYVDDPALLARSGDRGSLQAGPPAPRTEAAPLLRNREGWYRHHEAGQRVPSVVASLGGVLSGSEPGRVSDEEILLAELLGTTVLDAVLAWRLWQSAAARGLGDRVDRSSGTRPSET